MKEFRETFFEDFNYFKKNLTPRMLYVNSEGKFGYSKKHDVLYYLFTSSLVIGLVLSLLELNPIFVLPVMGVSVFSFLIANLLDILYVKKTLKKETFPIHGNFINGIAIL